MRKVFSNAGEELDSQLSFIRKNEIRINRSNEQAINQLGQIAQMKKSLAAELRSLITKVKNLDYESKELQNSIFTVTNAFDEKVADAGGTKQLDKVRHSLRDIKEQVR